MNQIPAIILAALLCAGIPCIASGEGTISVTSSPESAEIFLNGTATGLYTPAVIGSVPAGSHTVLLVLSGYANYTESVTVTDSAATTMDTVSLTNLTSGVTINSVPYDAKVTVDGTSAGYTNDTFTLAYGSREIGLELAGYEDYTMTLLVNSTIQELTVEMTPLENGSLYVTSSPTYASVYIDDAWYGTTPLTVDDLIPGSYDVLVYREGYTNWTDTVTVTSGEEEDVYAGLDADTDTTTAVTTAVTTRAVTASTTVPTIAAVAMARTYDTTTTRARSTATVPTPWPTGTSAQESPAGAGIVVAAIGLGIAVLKRK